MSRKPIDVLIDQQKDWLDPLGKALVENVHHARRAMGTRGAQVFDFLHGVWLGHPLHAAMTDLPVGAWTVGALLDAVDTFAPSDALRRCADGAILLGTLGGLAAAPAGTADWHHTTGHARRVGLVHGLLNAATLVLYTVSLILRRGKARPLGVSLGVLGYSAATLSAYLGGELAYRFGVGVDHTAWESAPKGFVPVLAEAELRENEPRRAVADGAAIVLVKRQGHIYALAETCTHLGGPLSEGEVRDDVIVCPWHGSQFALGDGSVVHGPATFAEQSYDVRVRDGQVEVRPRR